MKWSLVENKWNCVFTFSSQTDLAEFVLVVAKHADEVNHHPDFKVFQCSKLEYNLYSHDIKGVSQRDKDLADFISQLYLDKWTVVSK